MIGVLDRTAEELGNTRAVVRSSYVDPRITAAFEDETVIAWDGPADWESVRGDDATREKLDRAVAQLIDSRTA